MSDGISGIGSWFLQAQWSTRTTSGKAVVDIAAADNKTTAPTSDGTGTEGATTSPAKGTGVTTTTAFEQASDDLKSLLLALQHWIPGTRSLTIDGEAQTASIGDHSKVSVNGNNNTIHAGPWSDIVVNGNGNTVYTGEGAYNSGGGQGVAVYIPQTTLTLAGNNNSLIAGTLHQPGDVSAITPEISNVTVDGNRCSVELDKTFNHLAVNGRENLISFGNGTTAAIRGNGNYIFSKSNSGNYIEISGANNDFKASQDGGGTFTISGLGNTIDSGQNNTTSVSGTDNTVHFQGGEIMVSGEKNIIEYEDVAASDSKPGQFNAVKSNKITVSGQGNIVRTAGAKGGSLTVSGQGNIVDAGPDGSIVISGNQNIMQLHADQNSGANTQTLISGNDNTINCDDKSTLTVSGANNIIHANNCTITLADGVEANIIGQNNTIVRLPANQNQGTA